MLPGQTPFNAHVPPQRQAEFKNEENDLSVWTA